MSEGSWAPKSRVSIVIRYGDERTARSVAEAVSPDNLDAPQDLRVETLARGGNVFTVIEGRRAIETIVPTVEDLLSCIQAAERAIDSVGSLHRGEIRGEKDKSWGPSYKPQPSEWL
ncbi:MAG: KEOPS complex subunit Pcc1 [Candidatus Bathyarchaeia archaeon]